MALLAETIKKLLTKAGFDTSSESYLKLIQKGTNVRSPR